MLTIGELVALDEQAQFRNDVQLDAVDDPVKNMALLKSYLFTGSAPNIEVGGMRSMSSIDLLDQIVQAFLSDRLENRLVAIANYGHGKSHLALALANYFSKPFDSLENQTLLAKIDSAVSDQAKALRYRKFKESKGEFLVVRLRGDATKNLHEQVIAGIERAIDEHPAIAGKRPNFWYASAETFLENLSGNDRSKADSYLEQYNIDVPQLLRQVEQRQDVYHICVNLSKHLYQVPLNFGGETGLKQIINWTVQTCCNDDGPISGLLILFDEFSFYVERYGQRGAAAELQDLLNGVDDHQGKVVFLAFAQGDPVTVASNLVLQGTVRESLIKALTRLPKKFALHSLMESVIDAYLKQNDTAWKILQQEPRARGSIYQATDITMELFKARYDRSLRWSFEKFQETIAKGCFPLHPITTALLCNLRLPAVGDIAVPRTVLGFVLEQLGQRKEELAVVDGRINWVLPVYLIDYFEPRLRGEQYVAYKNALRRLNPEAPPEYEAVLKGLLLQELAELKPRGEEQVLFLAHCAGISDKQTIQTLKALVESRCIRYDPVRKVNLFIASDESPEALDTLISEKLVDLVFDENAAAEMVKDIATIDGISFGQISVGVSWGESSDWAAKETLIPARMVSSERLRNLVDLYATRFREVSSGDRGCVVWIWASTEEELTELRSSLTDKIDTAFDCDAPIPLVCILPVTQTPELLDGYQRLCALKKFTQDERQRVGQKTYEDELTSTLVSIVQAFQLLRGEEGNYLDLPRAASVFGVPLAYRATTGALSKPSVRKMLESTYSLAYRNAPPAFFTQYKLSNVRLKNATKQVASLLLENLPETLRTGIRADNVAGDLCTRFLQKEWGMLTADYRIREPDNQAVRRAWEFLDASFPPGCTEIRVGEVIVALLNPPHGYDHNTVTLLFCGWVGFNSQDLQVSIHGRLSNRTILAESLRTGPKEFINEICIQRPLSLARRDAGQIVNEVRSILEQVQRQKFTQDQASKAIATLEEFSNDARNNAEIRELAANGVATLRDGLKLAEEYDQQVATIIRSLNNTELRGLIALLGQISKLPHSSLVFSTAQSPVEVRTAILDRLTIVVEMDCANYEKLQRLTQLDNNISQLRTRRDIVEKAGIAPLVQRFDKAIETVQTKAEQLKAYEQEETVRVEIRGMDTAGQLSKLMSFRRRLEEITGLSDETMRLRNQRLQTILEEIRTLEEEASAWTNKLDNITELAPLQREFRNLMQIANRYADTPFTATIALVEQRIQMMQTYLYELGTIQSSINGNIRTQKDSDRMVQQLVELRNRYASNLTQSQLQKVDEVVTQVQDVTHRKIQNALTWLNERQNEYQTSRDLLALKKRLEAAPDFLPKEAHSQLDSLKYDVQHKIDADIATSIEQKFLEIADIEQRRKCIQRLESLLQAT
jgi:hypothetical protein